MNYIVKRISIIALVAFCFSAEIAAQTARRVSGTVRDTDGNPVIGAVVTLDGNTRSGATTDINGKYTFDLPAQKGVLRIQCMGYLDGTASLGNQSTYDFILTDDNQMLESVVVVGYGTMRESDVTGSVSRVKIDEGNAGRSMSIDQMLKGRAAGVQVQTSSGAPDAGINIRIRGNSSFNGSGEPLYVVDGIIINSSNSSVSVIDKSADEDEETNGLLGIDPQDIASMEILKDASATAIYGAQGANGVILITTKNAVKEKPVISFSAGLDVSERAREIKVLSFDQYLEYISTKGYMSGLANLIEDPYDLNSERKVEGVNWQDIMMRTAISKRYYFSVMNRNKTTNYSFSVSFKDIEGIMTNTDLTQISTRLNLDQKITDKFKFGTKLGFSKVDSEMLQGIGSNLTTNTSAIRSMLSARPYYYPDDTDDDASGLTSDYGARPDRWLKDYRNGKTQYRVMPNIYAEYDILPWLKYKLTAGGDYRVQRAEKWKGPFISFGVGSSIAGIGTYRTMYYNVDNMLMFDKPFGKNHNISGTIGTTFHQGNSKTELRQGWGVTQYMAQVDNINSAAVSSTTFSYSESANATLSFLARVVYNYKGRYVFTGTFRRDGSSRFSKSNRYANFPSAAFAWRINEEPWFNFDKISTLKLRLGWGRVGNQALSSYQTLSNFNSVWFPDHTTGNEKMGIRGMVPSNLANPKLKWETTEQTNAGIDLRLNRNRLSFTIDVYNKNTFDLLQRANIPVSSGFTSMWMNIGSINNRGIECSIDAVLIKKRDINWSVFGNITHNKNKIVEIGIPSEGEGTPFFYGTTMGSGNYCATPVTIFVEGKPMGLLYGIKTEGIIQEGETGPGLNIENPYGPGQVKYVDYDGNGYIDLGDRQILGDPNPDFTFGFGTSFTWKNLNLDIQFEGSYGNDIANLNLIQENDVSRLTANVRADAFYKAWTPSNTNTDYPALSGYSSLEDRFFTSRCIEDGSYLRLASVTLSYELHLRKKLHFIDTVNFALSGSNLLLFTNYKGWDPDVNTFGGDILKMGCDSGSYPRAKTISFDVKLKF